MITRIFLTLALPVLFVGCGALYDDDNYLLGHELPLDSVIRLEVLPADRQIPADGASSLTFHAIIPPNADEALRTVAFSTSSGTFDNGEPTVNVRVSLAGVAMARLRGPVRVDSARVTATVNRFVRDTVVHFVRALPETLTLDAGVFALGASYSSTTTLTAALHRSVGTPTAGASVSFSASDSTGSAIGSFRQVSVSNEAGRATAIFTPGATPYRGPIFVRAVTQGIGGDVSAVATVVVVNP
jgi:hypothetical protein